ncbi:MAG: hypothetical protein ACFCVE_04360 [Phycisphaerae bacterium]
MRWSLDLVADDLAAALRQAEQAMREEQAVYGLDAKDELALQQVLAEGLAGKYAVAREVHYPSSLGKKLSNRKRCDLVLCDAGRPLRLDAASPDLFTPTDLSGPGEALWLEVKAAYQYRAPDVRHRGYGSQWRQAVVKDLRKMEEEPQIREAALVLVVFNASDHVLESDLQYFEDVLAQKEVLAGFRQVRSVPITDRMGHTVASVAVWPTIQREPG